MGQAGRVRPILRPGTHVLNRVGGELQVGLDPDGALLLPASEPVRRSLALLAGPADRDSYPDEAAGVVSLLERHGQLADERDLLPLLPATGNGTGQGGHTAAALVRSRGAATAAAWRSRTRWRTAVRTFGHPVGASLAGELGRLLRAAGLPEPQDGPDLDTGVLVGVGEPQREDLDEWTRERTPYLVVRMTEGRAVLGPFVGPGRSACLRCVDAHRTDADRSWPLLVRQYAAAAARDRSDGAPEPVDPLLASIALAWAARDLATYVDGGRPSTWSATITVAPDLSELETRAWLRHPACCCTWE